MILFDFDKNADLNNWYVVDDGVMGGLSQGNFQLNEDGHGLYTGEVSLENNGGFSSLRYRFESKEISRFTKVKIHCKGDGKRYQFRTKIDFQDRHSYITYFETSGEWEVVELLLSDMKPAFRGRDLDMPNFPGKDLEEIAFLIGNKKEQRFELLIDKIELE